MKFFFDHNLPPRIARALHELSKDDGHSVVANRDKFDPRTPDVEWIRVLGEEGDWVIVSGDRRISRNPAELEVWMESGCTAFFLDRSWSKLPLWEKSWRLVQWWPILVQTAESVGSVAGYLVPSHNKKLRIITRHP